MLAEQVGKRKRKEPEGAAMSADQAHQMLGGNAVISRSSFYGGIRRGEIPSLRIGKRILVPRHAFTLWLEKGGSDGVAK